MTDEELKELIEQDKDAQREENCGACACPLKREGACPPAGEKACGGCAGQDGHSKESS